MLDAGCGSARLTPAFGQAGAADVVGIDTSLERLAEGRARLKAHRMGARVKRIEADFDAARAAGSCAIRPIRPLWR